MTTVIKDLEVGLTFEQIASLLQKQTKDVLYICNHKLHNVGSFDNTFEHFCSEGQKYEIILNDKTIPSWTLCLKMPATANPYTWRILHKPCTFFDKDTVDKLLSY